MGSVCLSLCTWHSVFHKELLYLRPAILGVPRSRAPSAHACSALSPWGPAGSHAQAQGPRDVSKELGAPDAHRGTRSPQTPPDHPEVGCVPATYSLTTHARARTLPHSHTHSPLRTSHPHSRANLHPHPSRHQDSPRGPPSRGVLCRTTGGHQVSPVLSSPVVHHHGHPWSPPICTGFPGSGLLAVALHLLKSSSVCRQ